MSAVAYTVTLPSGLWLDGVCCREAALRPISGVDEALLLEEWALLDQAARVSALLARCLTGLGRPGPASIDAVRSLSVGDREALLLHLRRISLGDAMQATLRCPACDERLDVELRASELLLPPYSQTQPCYETTVSLGERSWRLSFRLPNGGDQEAAATLARDDLRAAAEQLARRCVVAAVPAAGDGPTDDDWLPAALETLSALMSELDPQAELILNLTCPACGSAFRSLFDTAGYLFAELAERAPRLDHEVHMLAFHYHWSEAEILRMTARKRRRYLELLADELAEARGR